MLNRQILYFTGISNRTYKVYTSSYTLKDHFKPSTPEVYDAKMIDST